MLGTYSRYLQVDRNYYALIASKYIQCFVVTNADDTLTSLDKDFIFVFMVDIFERYTVYRILRMYPLPIDTYGYMRRLQGNFQKYIQYLTYYTKK